MADVGNQHVAAARSEGDFVGEHRPFGIRVAREKPRIALASPITVTAQNEAALAGFLRREVVEDLVCP